MTATDPETDRTESKPVTALIVGEGEKDLVKISVDIDGDQGDKTAPITATDEHPFWVEGADRWVNAEDLESGMLLRTSAGTHVQVEKISKWTAQQRVHNLTIGDVHTYYVVSGDVPVLTHNAGCRTFGIDIPETQGVYIIMLNDGKIYVGSATKGNTIHARIHAAFTAKDHAVGNSGYKAKDVQQLDWFEMPGEAKDEIKKYEQMMIDYYGGVGGGKLLNRMNAVAED
ncbi:polymorphic toxin-type HINT domain-containing protein [Spongiactinospora rosea]|uniref:polymorphic toxin-type HINT domain-containing protein n=1 Tax=Spongiactinospora rosea TaxID=2248750 RepID=UPI0018F5C7C1|nr:polymorphic toxin-type HINT domain-containing protein [Spongiactinospora rosea]